jgi:ADP-ribosylglycohydrolase
LATGSGFRLEIFSKNWQAFFETYQGYRDQATRKTLENFKNGKGPQDSGSPSSDLGGAVRIAPRGYCYRGDRQGLVAASRAQTAMTPNHPHVIDSAEFLARVALKALGKIPPKKAIESVADENFNRAPFDRWVAEGLKSAGKETRAAISGFGQMCEVGAAFPSVIHLLVRYEENLKEALMQNVMAGGDSAARGMAAGMILGAYLGTEAIPADWLADLKSREAIMRALDRIDRL